MAVAWTSDEHDAVDAILNTYPAQSGRCFEAARGVLPIGRARDPATSAWKIKPRQGRFVVPKVHTGKRWFHHYTVEVERHGVDALTGATLTALLDQEPDKVIPLLARFVAEQRRLQPGRNPIQIRNAWEIAMVESFVTKIRAAVESERERPESYDLRPVKVSDEAA